jgi:hypothetical protein
MLNKEFISAAFCNSFCFASYAALAAGSGSKGAK